jgi:hypothetical protein
MEIGIFFFYSFGLGSGPFDLGWGPFYGLFYTAEIDLNMDIKNWPVTGHKLALNVNALI